MVRYRHVKLYLDLSYISLPPSVHGKEPLPTLDASVVKEVRKELCAIRDKVNVLIDAIDRVPKSSSKASDRDAGRTAVATSSPTQPTQSPQAAGKAEGMGEGGKRERERGGEREREGGRGRERRPYLICESHDCGMIATDIVC